MSKTRVYELAQKLGLDNKALMERLQQAGVSVKNHMAVLEESDVKKLEAASAPASEQPVKEERVSAGLIRRRRKETPTEVPSEVASEPTEAVAAPVEVPSAPPAVEAPVVVSAGVGSVPATEAAPEPVVAAPVAPKAPKADVASREESGPAEGVAASPSVAPPEAASAPPQPAVVAAVVPEEKPSSGRIVVEIPKTAAPARDQRGADKATPGRARILGRVELPQPAAPSGPRRDEAARSGRPAAGAGERPAPRREGFDRGAPRPAGSAPRPAGGAPGGPRPARPLAGIAPAPAPADALSGKEQRSRKKKKGKGDHVAGEGFEGAGRKGRREVFEPERNEKLRRGKKPPKPPKKTEITVSKAIKRIIRISDSITVGELAKRMGVKATDLIKELMRQGTMVTINHPLDFETAAILAADFQYEVENVAFDEESMLETAALKAGEEETGEDLVARPPVVTIMGHVDHGKTSLLDAIRATNVTAGEAGGITQHIGAYDVELDGRKITFLDTPGHEAFTAMRARGAKVTDIVILVVAADDGVMPQTKEAINHAKAAGVPIVVAVNKIDKPEANVDRVKQELTEFGLVCEEWGGETIFCEVSAKKRINLEQLLEMVLLQAEVLDLKANPAKKAKGTIVEARLDRGRGPVATVLVQEGTLKIGDPVVSGIHYGRVRTMTDDRGNRVEAAGPSFPVEVTGLTGVPAAGDTFHAVEDEKVAKDVAQHREQKLREAELAKSSKISLEQLYARIQQGEAKELKVVIKGDVQGSVEAVKDSLLKLSTDACRLVVIHTGVGGITESDVTLATASDAIVLGFNIRPEAKAANLAESEGVDIRLYNIIYDAVADIRSAMEGLLAPTLREKALGRVEVRETFSISKIGTIAGCYVLDGKVTRHAQVRLVRDSVVIWTGKMHSLKRFKDDAREVAAGYECGIGLENYNDVKVGDIIEAFEMEEVKTTL